MIKTLIVTHSKRMFPSLQIDPNYVIAAPGDRVEGMRANLILIDRNVARDADARDLEWMKDLDMRKYRADTPILFFDDRPW